MITILKIMGICLSQNAFPVGPANREGGLDPTRHPMVALATCWLLGMGVRISI